MTSEEQGFSQERLAACEQDYHGECQKKLTGEFTYEDRLRVWTVAVKEGMAASYTPADGPSVRGSYSEAASGRLLVSLDDAVKELNANPALDVAQLRAAQLERIVAEFQDVLPPYPSFDPTLRAKMIEVAEREAERRQKKRQYMREYMRQRREAEKMRSSVAFVA